MTLWLIECTQTEEEATAEAAEAIGEGDPGRREAGLGEAATAAAVEAAQEATASSAPTSHTMKQRCFCLFFFSSCIFSVTAMWFVSMTVLKK
jgi:hypothetical protein